MPSFENFGALEIWLLEQFLQVILVQTDVCLARKQFSVVYAQITGLLHDPLAIRDHDFKDRADTVPENSLKSFWEC